ncbi:MAG: PIN domain-containing protein [Bauldia sp.]|nr:PIN domain-containing protein [Bauldia sp.]
MIVDCFLDSNVLIYAAAGREDEEAKRIRARDLVEQSNFAISGQVLQEFFVVVTRKIPVPMPVADAAEWVDRLALRPLAPVDAQLVQSAITISRKFQVSYWDAAIVAAARSLDAPLVYTEDLNHGQTIGDVRIVNPFL